ncbi:MAG TPA: hypothetical protein VGD37_38720 [Kofleriaceae bacterium]
MRALSPNTAKLLDELERLAHVRVQRPGQDAQVGAIVALLDGLANTAEPLAIPRIISLVLDRHREVAEAAGRAVARLRRAVKIRDLGLFDRAFRGVSTYAHPVAVTWRFLRPADLQSVATLTTAATILQLAMCHPSGYVREEAIRRSAACADGSEIAFLLLRVNDWVEPVQNLARAVLRTRLGVDAIPHLVAALPLIDEMRRWGRLGGNRILEEIDAALGGHAALPALYDALSASDRLVRLGAFRRLLARDPAELGGRGGAEAPGAPYRGVRLVRFRHEIVEAALRDPDPAIHAWAARWSLAAGDDVFVPLSGRLVHDRLGSVRLGVVQRLIAHGSPWPWRELLLDRQAGVRALAQGAALDAGTDPADEYRGWRSSSHAGVLGIALLGLGETGGPDDAELVRAHLADRRPAVRRRALQALCNFQVDDAIALCLAALADDSPGVTHTARDLLLARVTSVPPARVWSVFEQLTTTWGQSDALAVLSATGYWDGLPYLLRACNASGGAAKVRARRYLEARLARRHRVFTAPPPPTADAIRSALANPAFSDELRREIHGVLDTRIRGAGGR